MTDHEMILLRAAVEACEDVHVRWQDLEWRASTRRPKYARASCSLATALSALLADLGADVPEWPSEERVAHLGVVLADSDPARYLRSLALPEYLALRGGS